MIGHFPRKTRAYRILSKPSRGSEAGFFWYMGIWVVIVWKGRWSWNSIAITRSSKRKLSQQNQKLGFNHGGRGVQAQAPTIGFEISLFPLQTLGTVPSGPIGALGTLGYQISVPMSWGSRTFGHRPPTLMTSRHNIVWKDIGVVLYTQMPSITLWLLLLLVVVVWLLLSLFSCCLFVCLLLSYLVS